MNRYHPQCGYSSPARKAFRQRAVKIMPQQPASALYINTTDPSYYEKRLRCNRHDVRALYCLGRKYEKAGALEKAREYYERATAADPYYEPAVGALILLRRTIAHKKQQEAAALQQRKAALARNRGLSSFRAMQTVLISYLLILLLVFGVFLR